MNYELRIKNILNKRIIKIFIVVILVGLIFTAINYISNSEKIELSKAKIVTEKKIYKSYETPKFKLYLNDKRNLGLISKAFAFEDLSIEASVLDKNGEKTSIKTGVAKEESNVYSIELEPTLTVKPGKYTLSANVKTGDGEKNFTQDFTWGVLALNPDKAVYKPGETAKLSIGVLDDLGEMVCNANVELRIKNEEAGIENILSTQNGKIKVNKECYSKSFTLTPDYETSYRVNEVGTYSLTLTAITKNGTHSIEDTIKVANNINFDIKRTSATRVYPLNKYPMIIDITANEDYKGVVQEEVPLGFAIIKTKQDKKETDYAARIIEKNNKRILQWTVDWKKGENYKLSYVYDTPNISPEFYIMGNLQLVNGQSSIVYSEGRYWQIANDAIAFVQEVASGGTSASGTTLAITVTVTTTVGNHLILSAVAGNARIISSATDSAGNTWQIDKTQAATNAGTSIASAKITSALVNNDNIWITFSGSSALAASVQEYSGLASTAWFDVGSGNGGLAGLASDSLATATTAQADELLYGATGHVSTVTSFTPETQSPTWNQRTTGVSTTTVRTIRPMDRIVSSTGTYAAKATWTTNTRDWGAAIATYKAGASGINVSGNVYNAGTANALTACDANAGTFELSLRTNGTTYTASCSNTDGSYTFTSVTAGSAGSGMVAWINDLSTDGAIAIRYDGTGDSTLNTFYNDTVTITSDDTNGVTNAIMDAYDANGGDVDIPYVVTTNNLTASSGAELLVKLKSGVANGSTVYAPGGTVTTNATGGDFHIDDNSAASLDTATSAVGRDILIDTGATLTISGSTTIGGGDITATGTLATSGTPTVTIRGTGNISGAGTKTIYNLTVGDGTTATTTLTGALTISNDASVGTGSTFNINADITVTGSLTNTTTGIINHTANSPVVTVSGTSIGGGSGNITFYRLQKAGAGTTTFSGSGTNTINNTLDATAGTLTLSTNNVITIAQNVSASTSATLNQNTSLTINGGNLLTAGTGVVNTTAGTGTVTISGTGNIGGGGTVTVYNLTVNGTQTLASATTTSTDVSVSAGATLALGSQNLTVNGGDFTTTTTGSITCSGCSAGTVTMSTTGSLGGGSGAITFYNLTTSGTGTTTFSGSGTNSVLNNVSVGAGTTLNLNSTISITGSLTNATSGVIGTSAGTPTVTISGTSIGGGTTGAITFYALTKAGAGATTFANGGTNTINSNLSVSNGTLTQSDILTVTGTAAVSTGATFNTNANLTINGGALTTAGTGVVNTTAGTGTVTINGTGGNIGGGGTVTVYNLVLGGTGTQTLASGTTSSTDVSVGTGKTLSLNNQNLTVGGGDLTTTSTGSITCSGTTGTATVNGTAATGIGGGAGAITFCNLTIGGTVPIASAITINNDMTNNGATSGSVNVTVNGNVVGTGSVNMSSGTFKQRAATGKNFGTTSSTSAWAFSTLTLSNSSGSPITITTQSGGSGTITTSALNIGEGGDTSTTTLNAANRSWIISGGGTPVTLSASSGVTASTSTFTYTGTGSVTLGNFSYYSLATNNSGTYSPAASPLTATNNVTVTLGTLSLGTNDLNVGSSSVTNSGGISVAGTLSQSASATTTIVSSSAGAATIGGAGTITFYNLSFLPAVASAPTFTLGSGASQTITVNNDLTVGNGTNSVIVTANTNNPIIDVNGSLAITASGTFTAPGSSSFTIAANFTNNGTFNNNSGTVTFNGAGIQTLTGSGTPAITFYNLVLSSGQTVKFTAGKTFRTNGLFTVSSSTNIDSTTASQWFINHQGTETVAAGTISNSGCDGTSTDITVTSGTNGGNNGTCWAFAVPVINSGIKGNTRISGSVRFK